MTTNTEIWDKLKRVPPEHLKAFKRGGGFTGTAIKPMWTFHRVTEVLGPVGKGWTIDEPLFETVPGHDGEMLVFCKVAVTVEGGHRFFGVGGDKVVKYIKADERYSRPERWENDDEAFKKAYTDALTNALKLLGAGADVHMGLWDGNKYVDDKPEPEAPRLGLTEGTQGASKAGNRSTYDTLVKGIRNAPTLTALNAWQKNNGAEIDKLPSDWVDELRVEFMDKKSELTKGLAA